MTDGIATLHAHAAGRRVTVTARSAHLYPLLLSNSTGSVTFQGTDHILLGAHLRAHSHRAPNQVHKQTAGTQRSQTQGVWKNKTHRQTTHLCGQCVHLKLSVLHFVLQVCNVSSQLSLLSKPTTQGPHPHDWALEEGGGGATWGWSIPPPLEAPTCAFPLHWQLSVPPSCPPLFSGAPDFLQRTMHAGGLWSPCT